MIRTSKVIIKRLRYNNDSFPGLEWNEFLKNYNVNFYTSRKDRLWYSIRGKGYIMWISSSYPKNDENRIYWLIDLEILKSSPQVGFTKLYELIEGAIAIFDKMELENN